MAKQHRCFAAPQSGAAERFAAFRHSYSHYMALRKTEDSFVLDDAACDAVAARITEFCRGLNIENRDVLRYRLAAEERMLHWLSSGCAGARVRLSMGHRMLTPFIVLDIEDEPLNPFQDKSGEYGPCCGGILSNLRLRPDYVVEKGRNRILLNIRRKRLGQLAKLAIVIVLSILLGPLGRYPCRSWPDLRQY